jgi:very-short-patch-repair endonuclease
VRLANGLSESPLESLSRFSMRGLEHQPQLQVRIYALNGSIIARVDFFWPEFALVGEADGMDKYDAEELKNEKRRAEALANAGFRITRWGWSTA